MQFMPPKERTIIPPPNGWNEHCVYIVEASFSPANLIHRYLFYTGFLQPNGEPGNYNEFFGVEDRPCIHEAHYIKALHEVAFKKPNTGFVTLDGEYNLLPKGTEYMEKWES